MPHILLVDDSDFMRMSIKRVLETPGYEFSEANSVKNACDKLKETTFDLILLDYRMPDDDGIVLLNKLKKHTSPPPAIVLTADLQKQTVEECMEAGAFRVLHKPPRREDLFPIIEEALSARGN